MVANVNSGVVSAFGVTMTPAKRLVMIYCISFSVLTCTDRSVASGHVHNNNSLVHGDNLMIAPGIDANATENRIFFPLSETGNVSADRPSSLVQHSKGRESTSDEESLVNDTYYGDGYYNEDGLPYPNNNTDPPLADESAIHNTNNTSHETSSSQKRGCENGQHADEAGTGNNDDGTTNGSSLCADGNGDAAQESSRLAGTDGDAANESSRLAGTDGDAANESSRLAGTDGYAANESSRLAGTDGDAANESSRLAGTDDGVPPQFLAFQLSRDRMRDYYFRNGSWRVDNYPLVSETSGFDDSCRNQCGTNFDSPCSCSAACVAYDTCCADFYDVCGDLVRDSRHLLWTGAVWDKVRCFEDSDGVFMIYKCPPGRGGESVEDDNDEVHTIVRTSSSNDARAEIQRVYQSVPVTDNVTGIVYKSYQIFDCYVSNRIRAVPWMPLIAVQSIAAVSTRLLDVTNSIFNFSDISYIPPSNLLPYKCSPLTLDTCPEDYPENEIRTLCEKGPVFYVIVTSGQRKTTLKNPACVHCNLAAFSEQVHLKTSLSLVIYKSMTVFRVLMEVSRSMVRFSAYETQALTWESMTCRMSSNECRLDSCTRAGANVQSDCLHANEISISVQRENPDVPTYEDVQRIGQDLFTHMLSLFDARGITFGTGNLRLTVIAKPDIFVINMKVRTGVTYSVNFSESIKNDIGFFLLVHYYQKYFNSADSEAEPEITSKPTRLPSKTNVDATDHYFKHSSIKSVKKSNTNETLDDKDFHGAEADMDEQTASPNYTIPVNGSGQSEIDSIAPQSCKDRKDSEVHKVCLVLYKTSYITDPLYAIREFCTGFNLLCYNRTLSIPNKEFLYNANIVKLLSTILNDEAPVNSRRSGDDQLAKSAPVPLTNGPFHSGQRGRNETLHGHETVLRLISLLACIALNRKCC